MFNYILCRLSQFLALRLPLQLSYALAVFISDVRSIFAVRDRSDVRENLKIIFPDKRDEEIAAIRRAMFRNFARCLVDFLRFSKIDQEYIQKNVVLEGMHHFDEALAQKKGVVALSAHIGNWELGAAVIALSGYPFSVVAFEHKHKKLAAFFRAQRERMGIGVIPLKNAARPSIRALGENKMVALVGDIDFGGKMIKAEFFGRAVMLPQGPAALALATGAVIVPGFMLRNKDGSFTLKIEPPINFIPSGNKGEDLTQLMFKCKSVIEDYIRRYPQQWHMFRKFS